MPVEVSDEDVPTDPVSDCDGLHVMGRRQERRQSNVEMNDEIVALFNILFCFFCSTAGPCSRG